MVEKVVVGMALLRVLSGSIELTAAFLMYRLQSVEKALIVNSSLALVGPLVFIAITALGLFGMADRLTFGKLMWIGAGVACLLIGILKK